MPRWKVPLPAAKPDEGKRHVVVATGQRGGSRIEWSGQLTEEQVTKIWEIILPTAKEF